MRKFSTGELSRLQGTQESAMQDTCQIMSRTPGAVDEYGMPTESYTLSATIPCGFDPTGQREVSIPEGGAGGTQVVMSDALLRVPLDTVVDNTDRVIITHRFGVVKANPQTFSILGDPAEGPSGLVLALRLTTE